jgi:glyoxylase-like metal-dependent hydrolase (beta-lactamase superfamily II)
VGNDKHRPAVPAWDHLRLDAFAFEDSIQPVYEASQVRLWEDTHTIDANLRLEAAPGHTPGSSVVKPASGSDRALFAGDVLHTPLQLAEPGHNSCFCEDPVQARGGSFAVKQWGPFAHR